MPKLQLRPLRNRLSRRALARRSERIWARRYGLIPKQETLRPLRWMKWFVKYPEFAAEQFSHWELGRPDGPGLDGISVAVDNIDNAQTTPTEESV